MNKDEELIFGELEKEELKKELIETFTENVKGMSEEELKEVLHKEKMYREMLEELDGEPDDFFMDYETYEEME